MALAPLGLTVPITEVLDPEKWRMRYVFGHQLGYELRFTLGATTEVIEAAMRDLAGRLPEDVIQYHLRASLSELGGRLGVSFERLVVKGEPIDDGLAAGVDYDIVAPRMALTLQRQYDHQRIDVGRPLLSVERIRLYIEGQLTMTVLPSSTSPTIRIADAKDGVIHLIGGIGNVQMSPWSGWGIGRGTSLPQQLQNTIHTGRLPAQAIPDAWSVDYTTGPISMMGLQNRIDLVLANWVALNAGRLMLGISGGSQAGGLGSTSVSIDGVSQNATVSQSAMYGLNAPMETAFEAITKSIDWAFYRKRLRGINVGGI